MPEPTGDRPSLNLEEFNRAKTRYFAQFAAGYVSMFRPHLDRGGILARTAADKDSREIWRNVSEHCLAEAALTDVLADELGLSGGDKRTVVSAAILHDWYKKQEKVQTIAAKDAGNYSSAMPDEIEARGDAELRDRFGIDPAIIELTHSNVPPTTAGPETLAKKMLWYTDHILSNTDVVRIEDRFFDLERGWDGTKEDSKRAAFNIAFSDAYKEKYGGRSLYDVQRKIGYNLGIELSKLIGFTGEPNDLPFYLKEKLEARIIENV